MVSVNLEMELSSEAGKKHIIAADFLNLKLQISSDYRVAEEEGYSPMATLEMPPLHDGIVLPRYVGTQDIELGCMPCNTGQNREETI